jgi:hypothetical protein
VKRRARRPRALLANACGGAPRRLARTRPRRPLGIARLPVRALFSDTSCEAPVWDVRLLGKAALCAAGPKAGLCRFTPGTPLSQSVACSPGKVLQTWGSRVAAGSGTVTLSAARAGVVGANDRHLLSLRPPSPGSIWFHSFSLSTLLPILNFILSLCWSPYALTAFISASSQVTKPVHVRCGEQRTRIKTP